MGWGAWVSFSSGTILGWNDKEQGNIGIKIKSLGRDQLDTQYKSNKSDTYFELHFDRLPRGIELIDIVEQSDNLFDNDGFVWQGVRINNPFPEVPNTGYYEASVKPIIDSQADGIVGIYQTSVDAGYKLACYKDGQFYKLIYLSSNHNLPQWKVGDLKALLYSTATPSLFKVDWAMADKTWDTSNMITFENNKMKLIAPNGEETIYTKQYPTPTVPKNDNNGANTNMEWSGTGFALKNNYIVTNYHVVDGATIISVQGINGDFNKKYKAKVIIVDKFNDLAILKIEDINILLNDIPYAIKTSTSEVGEDVFVLGYPLTSTMGEEIKLTTGVVSSKTGFQGDVSLYQISAPIQPGNSGGPLFDDNGDVIGIVSAKHRGAENVGYAIKASYLRNLMESAISENILPQTNKVAGKKLSDKVKVLKNNIYYITCR